MPQALAAQSGARAGLYAQLKLAGLEEAPGHLAVFADRSTAQGHGLGRHTMPEMIEYSAVTAVHTIWLAARAQGIGMGWVSILDPQAVAALLDVPARLEIHRLFLSRLSAGRRYRSGAGAERVGAAVRAVVRYRSDVKVDRSAIGRSSSPRIIAVSNQSRFAGIRLAHLRLTPGACPGKTEPVLPGACAGLLKTECRPIEFGLALEGESGVNLQSCQGAFGTLAGGVYRCGIYAAGHCIDRGLRRHAYRRRLRRSAGCI